MNYSSLINKVLKEFKDNNPLEIETAIICGVLSLNKIKKVNNLLIKTYLDNKTEYVEDIIKWFKKKNIKLDIKLLEKFYELNINETERKVNGSYYTPDHIVSYIVQETLKDKLGTVCDPACGSGAFLTETARYLNIKSKVSFKKIYSDYIYGIDILDSSINHTKIILSLLAILNGEDIKEFKFNLYVANSLSFNWKLIINKFSGFDFIVGNPPYVRAKNLDEAGKRSVKNWKTANFGNPDLYIPFFELGVEWINSSGRIGYITPSTYLTSLNANELRNFLSTNKYIEKIIDFNGWQIFPGATTYTCITILSKKLTNEILFTLVDKIEKINQLNALEFTKISLEPFGASEWRLLSKKDAENIFKIENMGSPLYKYVNRFVTGIATLNNDLFLVEENNKKLLEKWHDGKMFYIERDFTKKIIKPNKIKNISALTRNKERIIYPYQLENDKARVLSEKYIKTKFPLAYKYLLYIKDDLTLRDKGKKDYSEWYAYGRSQGVSDFGKKIILPMMDNKPSFIIVNDVDTLIYCGYAIFPKNDDDYKILEKILNSKVMWYYIKKTSKNYSGGFKSFAKNYVKNFSIPNLSHSEKQKLISLKDSFEVDKFLWEKYSLN